MNNPEVCRSRCCLVLYYDTNMIEVKCILMFQGCYQKTLDLLRDNLIIICGIGVAVAVIQVSV